MKPRPHLCRPIVIHAGESIAEVASVEAVSGGTLSLAAPRPSQVAVDLLIAHNKERQSRRLLPLRLDARLQTMADAHAAEMAQARRIGHERFAERLASSGYRYSTAGENAASGYRTTPDVVRGWMNSQSHRANIVSPAFVDVGFGVRITAGGEARWVAVFASPAR